MEKDREIKENKPAKRFKAIREALNLSQSELAKAIGIGQTNVSRIERGDSKGMPSSKVLMYLAEEGFNLNWLATGKGEMKTEEEGEIKALQTKIEALEKTVAKLQEVVEAYKVIVGKLEGVNEMALLKAA